MLWILVDVCDLSTREMERGGSLRPAGQPAESNWWDPRWTAPQEWHLELTSGHHIHTCAHAFIHAYSHTHSLPPFPFQSPYLGIRTPLCNPGERMSPIQSQAMWGKTLSHIFFLLKQTTNPLLFLIPTAVLPLLGVYIWGTNFPIS